jgi:hypothetical protein
VICAVLSISSTRNSAFAADASGIPISIFPGDQINPVSCSDGAGGVIIAWHDQRPTGPVAGTCYAQRLDAAGVPQWTTGGVALTTIGDGGLPVIAADGSGGAFVAYGGASTPARIQRINSFGALQWTMDGVQLTTTTTNLQLAMCADIGGSGGAFVAWRQLNGASGTDDIYGQRVNSSGSTQWGLSGLGLATSNTDNERLPGLVSDYTGGIFVVWNSGSGERIQRYNSNGNAVWSLEALSAASNADPPTIVADGTGGALIGWSGGGMGGGALTQRVSPTGVQKWGVSSSGLSLSANGRDLSILPDGLGGATITWQDFRSGTNNNLYAQKVSDTGAVQWNMNGNAVCLATMDQDLPKIATDGAGGSIIAWYDYRTAGPSNNDIYAQRLNGSGVAQWTTDGNAICTAPSFQENPTIVADGAGGVWIAWQDFRNMSNWDVFASHVGGGGTVVGVGPPLPAIAEARAWPNPFVDRVRMSFALEKAASVRMRVFDLHGGVVAELGTAALEAGAHEIAWDGRRGDGRRAAEGLYFLRVDGSGISLSRAVVALN